MIKFQLEAVPAAPQGGNHAQGGVSLGPDPHVLIGLPVDDRRAGGVFLILAGFDEAVPVVHDNIQGVYPGGIEQPGLIAYHLGEGLNPQRLSAAEQQGQQQGAGSS